MNEEAQPGAGLTPQENTSKSSYWVDQKLNEIGEPTQKPRLMDWRA